MSHGDHVDTPPPGFTRHRLERQRAGRRRSSTTSKPLYGVQFHPEVAHTPRGGEILNNFLFEICGCSAGLDRRATSSRARSRGSASWSGRDRG